jgi:hypothetical protein
MSDQFVEEQSKDFVRGHSDGFVKGWNLAVTEVLGVLAERLDIVNLLDRDSAEIQIIIRAVKQMSDK